MKMTLEITDVNEARAILAALSGPEASAPVTAAAQPPVQPATATAAAPVQPPVTAPATAAAQPPANPVPTAAPTYTIDQIARAGVSLMEANKQQDLLALLAQYGIQSIQQLRADQYGAFATALRGLGAQI